MPLFAYARFLASIIVLFLVPCIVQAQEQVIDEIVALVADKIILKSEVDGIVTGIMQQQQVPYSEDLWGQAFEQMIDQKVVTEHARRDTNIVITDEQVDQSLNARIESLTQQVGSLARLEEIYGKPVEQIRTDLRGEFREQLMADQLQNQKLQSIKVTPSEIREWFAQFPTDSLPTLPEIVRVSHIVRYPKITEAAEKEAMEIVSAIRDSVIAGTSSLEDMARRYTEDPGSIDTGGRYEDMSIQDLVPEFAAVAAQNPVGEISMPFKSPFGYHVLRVDARRGENIDFTHILINIDQSKAGPYRGH